MAGMAQDPRAQLQPLRLGHIAARHDKGGRPIRDGGGIGRRDRAILAKGGLERRDFVGPCIAGLFIDRDHNIALARSDSDRHDLACESIVFNRPQRILKRAQSIFILRGAGELERLRTILGECAHQPAPIIGILEPIEEHVILRLAMPHPRATAHRRKKVGGIRHALHPACHDEAGPAQRQRIPSEHRGLHPRAAHLVERGCRHLLGQSGLEPRLSRGGLSLTRGQDTAHQQLIDQSRVCACIRQRRGNRRTAQISRCCTAQRTLKAAHRRARRP